jgi:MYXO-CTERM domain-containing protein
MRIATLALVVGVAATAGANTGHHSSSSGSNQGECLRWEPIPSDMAGADLATSSSDDGGSNDGGAALDLGAPDLGSAPGSHEGMRCVERAGLFRCSFAPSGGGGSGLVAIMTVFALALGRRRRRQRPRV